jgi:hypothetical protein
LLLSISMRSMIGSTWSPGGVRPVSRFPARAKIVDAELFLELADLPAHAGLRGVEHGGDLGEVEAAARRLPHGPELLEVHGARTENAPQGAWRAIVRSGLESGNDRFVDSK